MTEQPVISALRQQVDCYRPLVKLADARTANERAKWLLRKMPAGAFEQNGSGPAMNKQYWEQWLKWSNDAGVFGAGGKGAPVADTPTGPAIPR